MKNNNARCSLWYAVFLILIDFMGLTITIVTFPKLILSNSSALLPVSFEYTHRFALLGLLLALYPLGQFFGASLFGKISDHWGRKKSLLVTLFGSLFGFLLTAISITFGWAALLFVSRLVSGLFAGNVAIAQAVIVDISDEKTKARNITFGQTAMGAAWIVGPIVGAYLSSSSVVGWFNYSTPFWFFCIIFCAFILGTLFFFKETLKDRQSNQIKVFEGMMQIILGFTSTSIRKAISIWFVFCFGWWMFEAFMPAYLFKHFSFTTLQIGHILAFNGLLFVLSQGLIVSNVVRRIKLEGLIMFAGLLAGLAMVSLAFVPISFIYVSMIIFVLGMSFTLPGLITSISNLQSADTQGQVMGIINSTQAFATVLVMLLGGLVNTVHGSFTIIGGGCIVIIACLLYSQGVIRAKS